MEFSRKEYWSGLPFPPPGDLSHSGIKPASPQSPHCREILYMLRNSGSIKEEHEQWEILLAAIFGKIYSSIEVGSKIWYRACFYFPNKGMWKGINKVPRLWEWNKTGSEGSTEGSVQSLSHVRLFVTPWTTAHQASLFITNSRSLPKLMSIELVMPSNHLILCHPLLLLPSIFPSIRIFSNESALHTEGNIG